MALDLRPLTLGELFDRAFMLYRRHFWLFVGIAAVPGVFALLINLANQLIQNVSYSLTSNAADEPVALASSMLWLLAGLMVSFAVYCVVYMIALGATTMAVSELYLGRSTTIGEAYARIRGGIGGLLALLLLIAVRVMGVAILGVFALGVAAAVAAGSPILGALFLFVIFVAICAVCFLMMLRYGLAVPALVLEGLRAAQAIRRSIALTNGRLGRVFLLVLCSTMLTYAAAILLHGPFLAGTMMAGPDTPMGMSLSIAGAVMSTIGTTLTAPFLIIGLALIYYDARIREEGFDLEMTLSAFDGAAAPSRA